MNNFDNIQFHGKFRDYQQRVLDNADKYLNDGRINIVAAPGSGKTVLGLELIRRLGEPCIILSPTTAIREQWRERFGSMFLEDRSEIDRLFSTDLHNIKLLNSITYQALGSAIGNIAPEEGEDEVDCRDLDVIELMREFGIKTVCLDEAHHLKNEWQKALEKFIGLLDCDVKIISLTATPPYDSEASEWARYAKVCGEIDEEIFVPELVAQGTLCPHQDYIYFNYPSNEEVGEFGRHKENVVAFLGELAGCEFLSSICQRLNSERNYEKLFDSAKGYIALMALLDNFGFSINKRLVKTMTLRRGLPAIDSAMTETAIQFLLDGELLPDEEKEELYSLLKKYSLCERRRASIALGEKLKRRLISSVGKLESIKHIVKNEYASMGDALRMLILTDYIKKENLSIIGTDKSFNSVNIVSIFETVRRENPDLKIGVLSGSLVILPESIELASIKHDRQPIKGTSYCIFDFGTTNHQSVAIVSRLFERGEINLLVGTKSLLGEGWDSPCINSLILASFVGSFVLSNQMRGRAIRVDRNHPEKVANIWHLVTVEPSYIFEENPLLRACKMLSHDSCEMTSCDFEILRRRFLSFIGPNYTSGEIESGIARLTDVAPPYDRAGIKRINREMLNRASDRDAVRAAWHECSSAETPKVVIETVLPKENRVPIFCFDNWFLFFLLMSIDYVFIFYTSETSLGMLLSIALSMFLSHLAYRLTKKLLLHLNPARSMKTLGDAVYKTMREHGIISRNAIVETESGKDLLFVSMYLKNATVYEQNIFNTAMAEMLSPIENPRYILIRRKLLGGYDYSHSFACPSVIGKKKEYAATLAKILKNTTGNFEAVYTSREDGRRFILKCRKKAYVTRNHKTIDKKYKVRRWE